MPSGTTSESYLCVGEPLQPHRWSNVPDRVSQNTRRCRLRGHEQWAEAANRIYSQKEGAIAERYCSVELFDCDPGNSRTFNFAVIRRSYSAGKGTLTVVRIGEMPGESLRIR
jgi:hypothetical protein